MWVFKNPVCVFAVKLPKFSPRRLTTIATSSELIAIEVADQKCSPVVVDRYRVLVVSLDRLTHFSFGWLWSGFVNRFARRD